MAYKLEVPGMSFVREGSGGIVKRATVEFEDGALIIDGMRVTFEIIPQFLYELANPDPRKWYRLERVGDRCIVHVKMNDETGEVLECPRCGFNTQLGYTLCPYDGAFLGPSRTIPKTVRPQ
jgi:hypothetical protein